MMRSKLFGMMLAAVIPAGHAHAQAQREVTFTAAGDTYHAAIVEAARGLDAPVLLLFHQGGSNVAGEYENIIPRLVEAGYTTFAVDVRGGGNRFGGVQRAPQTDSTFRYCMAAAELEASIDAARAAGFRGPLILVGSSYTAALAMQAAARRSADVAGVVAFSPAFGEPMAGCEPTRHTAWLRRAGMPLLVIREQSALDQIPAVVEQVELFARDSVPTLVLAQGVHGASTLDSTRVRASVAPQWTALLAFLAEASIARRPDVAAGEEAVQLESEGWLLHGTYRSAHARGPAPVVVMFNKAAGDRRVYRELARLLGERGIASLRMDLRGHGESRNRGRGVMGSPAADLRAVAAWLAARPDVDAERTAAIGASYSGEAVAQHGHENGYADAYVMLSPGSFSEESAARMNASGADWLFIRANRERFVTDWLDDRIAVAPDRAELWVLPANSAHASDLLYAHPGLDEQIADWLARRLLRE